MWVSQLDNFSFFQNIPYFCSETYMLNNTTLKIKKNHLVH